MAPPSPPKGTAANPEDVDEDYESDEYDSLGEEEDAEGEYKEEDADEDDEDEDDEDDAVPEAQGAVCPSSTTPLNMDTDRLSQSLTHLLVSVRIIAPIPLPVRPLMPFTEGRSCRRRRRGRRRRRRRVRPWRRRRSRR